MAYMPYIVCACLVVVSLFVGWGLWLYSVVWSRQQVIAGQYFVSTLSVLYQSVREAGCTEVLEAPHKPLAEGFGQSFDFILARSCVSCCKAITYAPAVSTTRLHIERPCKRRQHMPQSPRCFATRHHSHRAARTDMDGVDGCHCRDGRLLLQPCICTTSCITSSTVQCRTGQHSARQCSRTLIAPSCCPWVRPS